MPSSAIEAKVGLSSPRLDFWGLASSAKSASIRGEVSLLVVVRARKMKMRLVSSCSERHYCLKGYVY